MRLSCCKVGGWISCIVAAAFSLWYFMKKLFGMVWALHIKETDGKVKERKISNRI